MGAAARAAAMTADRFEALRKDLRAFVDAREWDRFHAPKDLALSVSLEAAELLELFQWRGPGDLAPDERARLAEECSDVLLYLVLLADKAGFDLLDAARAKLAANAEKYPVERAKGRATKYDRL